MAATFFKFSAMAVITLSLGGCYFHPVAPVQFQLLLVRAKAGDTDAQLEASRMLACPGVGCAWGPWRPKCNDAESKRWLRLAAEGGNADAIAELKRSGAR